MRKRRGLVVSLVLLLVAACAGPIAPPGTTQPGQPTPTASSTDASPSPTPTATTTATLGEPTPSTTLDQPTPTATASDAVPPTPSATPEYALVIHSADGVVTVEAPDGAVPPGTTISVGMRPADQAPPELVTAGVARACYTLEPEGTTFAEPVKVTITRPRNYYGDANNLPLLALATRTAEGAWEWLTDAIVWLTDETMAVAGWTSHFSCLYDWSDRTDLKINPPTPRTDKVGDSFTRDISLTSKDPRANEINFTNPLFMNRNPEVIDVVDVTAEPDPPTLISRAWTCLSIGEYLVEFTASIDNFAADNPFWRGLGNLGALAQHKVRIGLSGVCTGEEGIVDTACIVVHHEEFGEFVSWLEFLLWFFGGYDVDYVEVTLQGANDDDPVRLDPVNEHFAGQLGLHNAGPKQLQKVLVHTKDGYVIDVTDEVKENLGDIVVRFPEEDTIGECR